MSFFNTILANLPEVIGPKQRRLSFKEKLKWTGIVLGLFFLLGHFPLFGLSENALFRFELLSLILGARFGSIISLGIGPLVTSSIVLQLLNGSGIMKMDLTTVEGKKKFQGLQKLLAIFFIVFEAFIYIFMGGLAPAPELQGTALYLQLQLIMVLQLILGGFLIMLMDEVISKYGFGSGISLFIAAGVSESLMLRTFSPLSSQNNPNIATGAVIAFFQSIGSDPTTALLMISGIVATLVVFVIAVYSQAMKIEIPLSFGRVRGHGIRWPLSFIYTSNIPVILVAALLANIQLWVRLLNNYGITFLGEYSANGVPTGGLVAYLNPPNIVSSIVTNSLTLTQVTQAIVYMLFFIVGSVIFSIFWVQTAGMDSRSQAKQIMSSGLQIPGFRRDQRVLERLLDRYIWPLTVMGGITVGILAALADISGALTSGTGLLLTVMIVYRLYEEIAKQHMMDMHPMMRKFME
jgi:preprotein translocase subunit SecY